MTMTATACNDRDGSRQNWRNNKVSAQRKDSAKLKENVTPETRDDMEWHIACMSLTLTGDKWEMWRGSDVSEVGRLGRGLRWWALNLYSCSMFNSTVTSKVFRLSLILIAKDLFLVWYCEFNCQTLPYPIPGLGRRGEGRRVGLPQLIQSLGVEAQEIWRFRVNMFGCARVGPFLLWRWYLSC